MYTTVWFPSEDAVILLNIGGFYDQINATEGHCDVSGRVTNSKTKIKTLVGEQQMDDLKEMLIEYLKT